MLMCSLNFVPNKFVRNQFSKIYEIKNYLRILIHELIRLYLVKPVNSNYLSIELFRYFFPSRCFCYPSRPYVNSCMGCNVSRLYYVGLPVSAFIIYTLMIFWHVCTFNMSNVHAKKN